MDRGTRGHAILWSQFLELGKNRFFKKKLVFAQLQEHIGLGRGAKESTAKQQTQQTEEQSTNAFVHDGLCIWHSFSTNRV